MNKGHEGENIKPWRFQPGQSGNPNGKPKISPEERKLKECFTEAMALLRTKTMKEIRDIARDENQPVHYVIAAKSVIWAVDKGNAAMFSEIFNRTLGKAKEHIEISTPYDGLSKEELIEVAQQQIAKLKEKND